MTELKAFQCDESDVYAAHDAEEAKRLWHDTIGADEEMEEGYPRELTDKELDEPQPEFDENEVRTGEWTSVREFLEQASEPGWLCGSDF